MATSDKEQMSINVKQNKRLAMGVKLDGTSMQAKGEGKAPSKPAGGLSGSKKRND
jgi:hypothetical protein